MGYAYLVTGFCLSHSLQRVDLCRCRLIGITDRLVHHQFSGDPCGYGQPGKEFANGIMPFTASQKPKVHPNFPDYLVVIVKGSGYFLIAGLLLRCKRLVITFFAHYFPFGNHFTPKLNAVEVIAGAARLNQVCFCLFGYLYRQNKKNFRLFNA